MLDVNQLQKAGAADESGKPLMESPQVVPIEHFGVVSDGAAPLLSFAKSILTADALDKLEIPKRECLVGSWWRTGALGFIFGQRGLGKTWMSIKLACCLAEGCDCGPWSVPQPRRVLYVDGEMPLESLRERERALTSSRSPNLYFLSHYQHFANTGLGINLAEAAAQKALLDECERLKIEVLFLDNLSCLFSGVRENEADDWELVYPWLGALRNRGVSVCMVLHAGVDALRPRGSTRREDAAFWVIGVTAPKSEEDSQAKFSVSFATSFTKNREGSTEDEGPWKFTFETMAEGEPTTIRHSLEGNLEVFIQMLKDGLDSCKDIAEAMNVGKDVVSKLAKKAEAKRLIKIEGSGNQRRYVYIAAPL